MHASVPRWAAAALLLAAAAGAQPTCPVPSAEGPPAGPRVGLALGGGSARGLAHIGVLQVFEEAGVPVDLVAGTSMGAIVGALYASGRSASEVEEVAGAIAWNAVFSGRADRRLEPVAWRVDDVPSVLSVGVAKGRLLAPTAAFSDYRISRVLTTYLAGAGLRAGGDFDRLPVPFRAVATDLGSGERVVLGRGDLVRAVRASMSQPVLLPPTEIDGRQLVDGGLVDNLPTGVAREMGAEVVIAVDVSAPPTELREDADVLTVVSRMTELMMASGKRSFADPPDARIRPAVEAFASDDFDRAPEIVEAGRVAARAALETIQPLLCGRRAAPRVPSTGAARTPAGPVTSVEVKGLRRVSTRLVTRRLRVEAGTAFDLARAQVGLDAVWASNLFSSAWLEVARADDGGVALTVRLRERPRVRASVGMSYQEADNVRGFLRLRNGNLLGLGERLDLRFLADSGRSEIEGTMGSASLAGSPFGYRLGLRVAEDKPKVYDQAGEELGRAQFEQFRVQAAAQRALGHDGLLELAVVAGRTKVGERADVPFEARTDTVMKGAARVVIDTEDNRFWPSGGLRLDARGEQSLTALGASLGYWRASLRLDGYLAAGKSWMVEGHLFGGAANEDTTPVYDLHRVGGPVLVPGRSREEMWGPWAGAASLGLSFRPSPRFQVTLRAGAGNAFPDRKEIRLDRLRAGASLGIARSTVVGPISFDLGVGAGEVMFYVSLGFQ
jgi:NTE family protein